MASLESLWNNLDKQSDTPAFLRVDDVHPLDIYVGKDAMGERLLLFLTEEEPPMRGHYRALRVGKQLRQDGRWALSVTLVQPDLARLFSHLCQDLVDSSAKVSDRHAARGFFIAQIEKWQRLLARGQGGLLEESEVRGLFAELSYLERFAIPFRGIDLAVEGWVGPLEADQDFRLGDRLVEIKSCALGATSVSISSGEQLDAAGAHLFLVVVPLEEGNPGSGYVSLNDLVERVRGLLLNNNSTLTIFEDRLLAAGYKKQPEYAEKGYAALPMRHFRVAEGFPRIVASSLPAGLSHIRYEISLFACSPFEQVTSVAE